MPFVTFTVRRGLSAADKSRLSEAMLEAQVAAGYHQADRFHRFLEVDQHDLLVDPRFPDYATDRTDRFMVVEVIISSGRPTGTAATIADEAVRLFGERLHLAPQDILFVFHEVEPNLPRFPAASATLDPATQRRAVCVVAIPAHLSRLFALLHVSRPFWCSPFPRPDPPRLT
jgi:Tautomerase enzyme